MKTTSFALGALMIWGCSGTPEPSTPEQSAAMLEARRLLAEGQLDEALTVTDRILVSAPDHREARLLAAEGNLALSELGRSNTEALLRDAVRNLTWALELEEEDGDAWLQLAGANYRLGEFEAGRDAALTAARHLKSSEAEQEKVTAAVLEAARHEMQIFVAARQAELSTGDDNRPMKPEPATLELANQALEHLEYCSQNGASADAAVQSAIVFQWLGQPAEAAAVLERGIRATPGDDRIHTAYRQTFEQRNDLRACAGAYLGLAREMPDVPILQWYQGRALVAMADEQRGRGAWQGAVDSYREAMECYGQYRAATPSHAEACDQWLAICNLSIARTALFIGDLDTAVSHLFAAEDASPRIAEYTDGVPALFIAGPSHYAEVAFLTNRALAEPAAGVDEPGVEELTKTLAFNEELIRRHPDKFGFVYNNAGFAARDLGTARELEGRAAGATDAQRAESTRRALQLWEKSYAYYEKAVELSPDDPRVVNDCGLMLIYHLNRDFDRARELFDRAIAVGQPQLDALPDDANDNEREFFEEAVGDAYENIGVLMGRHLGKPFAEYKPFLEKSVKLFPYQRRLAAALLRNEGRVDPPTTPAGTTAPSAVASEAAAPQDDRAAKFRPIRKEAEAKVAAGDLDGALLVMDAAVKELGEYAPFRLLFGELTLRFANQARDAGRTSGLEHLYGDAVRNLEKAVELDSDPVRPRLLLCEARYLSAEFAAAAKEAASLISHVRSLGGGHDEEVAAAQKVRAEANARVYIDAKQNEGDGEDALREARAAFRFLEGGDRLDAKLCQTWVGLEQWAGAGAEAVGILTRALSRKPDDETLVAQLVDTAIGVNESARAVEALKDRKDPTGLWYLGRARFFAAEDLRLGGTDNFPKAQKELDSGRKAFEASMAGNPQFKNSCEQWIALCVGKKGMIHLAADDLDKAEQNLLEAVRLRPDRIKESLGGSDSVHRGILLLADRYFQQRNLAKTESIYRAAAAAAAMDVDFANNHGLFARDWGNALERNGKVKEANEMYEASYAAYTRACSLDPTNVRLLNDRALILVYHLRREWNVVEELLTEASVLGDKQLADSPPENPQTRRDLEEATGDCYENLALYHLLKTGNLDEAEKFAEKSREYYPGEGRPGARRHLAEIANRRKEDK